PSSSGVSAPTACPAAKPASPPEPFLAPAPETFAFPAIDSRPPHPEHEEVTFFLSPDGAPMNIDLSTRSAIVTGSTAGIGLAIATGLAQAGAAVVITGRTQARVDEAIAAVMK